MINEGSLANNPLGNFTINFVFFKLVPSEGVITSTPSAVFIV